jgi:hypothetical protein
MKSGDWLVKIILCLGSLCVAAIIMGIGLFLSQPTGFFGVLNSDNQILFGYGLVIVGIFTTFFSFSFLKIDKKDRVANISANKFNKIIFIIPAILLVGVFLYLFSIDMSDNAQMSKSQKNDYSSVEDQLYRFR